VKIFLYKNDEQFGPYSLEQVEAFVDYGTFAPIDAATFDGCEEGTTISQLPGIVISEEKRHQHLVPPFEAYAGDQPYVFVSYAHADGELVFREIKKLHQAGYRIWYDEGIEPGDDWPEHIAQAVIGCSLFLLYTSPRSAASENCRNEVNLALNRKKEFLSVFLEKTQLPPGLELRMGDLQAILQYRMSDAVYRKKLFAGLEKRLGPSGRDLPEGDDPVAIALARKVRGGSFRKAVPKKKSDASTRRDAVQPRKPTAGVSPPKSRKALWVSLIGASLAICLFFTSNGESTHSGQALSTKPSCLFRGAFDPSHGNSSA